MEENFDIVSEGQSSVFEKIAFVILFVISFLTPLFFVPTTFIGVQFGTSLLFAFGTIISILAIIISVIIKRSYLLPVSNKTLLSLFLVVPVVYVLAGVANGFSRMAFFGYTFDISTVGFIFLAFAYMFLVSTLFVKTKRIFYGYVAFVIASIILAIYLAMRIVFGPTFLSFGIFTTLTTLTVGNWNSVGIFFGISAILAFITHEMISTSRLMNVLLTLALLSSLFFLVLVNFLIVWYVILLSSLLFILYRVFTKEQFISPEGFKQKIRSKLSTLPIMATVVFVLALVCVVWNGSVGGFLARSFSINNMDVRPSFAVTLDIARNTLRTVPLFGSGPNTFLTQWLSYKPNDILATVFWNTDFTYGIGLLPTFAVTTGLFGLLSWLLFLGLYLYIGFKSIFGRTEDGFEKYLLISSFFVSLYLWLMAIFYVPSTVVFILTFYFTGLFLASAFATGQVPTQTRSFDHSPQVGFGMSFVLVVLFLTISTLGYGLFQNSKALWYFQESSSALNNDKDILKAESYTKKAIATVPMDVYYRALVQIEILKLNAIALEDPKTVDPAFIQKQATATIADTVTAGLNARNADQKNYSNWVSLGTVYQALVPLKVPNAYESALNAYNEAMRLNPKNPELFMYFARLEVDNGNLKNAENYVLKAIQAKQNYLDAYFLLAQIEVANKNLPVAIKSVETANTLNPNDPSILFQLGLLKYSNQDYKGAIVALENSIKLAPDYANAKYYLGISYEINKQHDKAIVQFQDLKKTNPDNPQVISILTALEAGKSIFADSKSTTQSTSTKLPVKETVQ